MSKSSGSCCVRSAGVAMVWCNACPVLLLFEAIALLGLGLICWISPWNKEQFIEDERISRVRTESIKDQRDLEFEFH
jgi:hypothetical protein